MSGLAKYIDELEAIYETLVAELLPIREGCCSCHINPPCNYCVEGPNPDVRDSIERLPVIIAALKETQ